MPTWEYHLKLEAPVSVFSGMSVAGLVDRMVVRERCAPLISEDGSETGLRIPVVPGATVKGRWRLAAEQLLGGLAGNQAIDGLAAHPGNGPACKRHSHTICTLCKWFGSPSVEGAIKVGPASLSSEWQTIFRGMHGASPAAVVQPDTEVRPGIGISRRFRTVNPDHLFFDETVPPVQFDGHIELAEDPSPDEAQFLRAAARMVTAIGARKAAGRGRLVDGIELGGGE